MRLELEQMAQEAEAYQKKANHNPRFLKKLEQRIERFVKMYNTLDELGDLDWWAGIDQKIKMLKQKDPTITGLTICFEDQSADWSKMAFILIPRKP